MPPGSPSSWACSSSSSPSSRSWPSSSGCSSGAPGPGSSPAWPWLWPPPPGPWPGPTPPRSWPSSERFSWGGVFAAAVRPALAARREAAFAGLVLASLWLARSIDGLAVLRTRGLLETTIAHAVLTQETWGSFLIEESLPGLDRSEKEIVAFFKDPRPSQNTDLAHGLWAKTSVAKSNWHSSLEVRDAEGNTLSRFSLNVPKILGAPPTSSRPRTGPSCRTS